MAHSVPITEILLALITILAFAKLGGHLAVLLGQPEVLGELVAGVILGNLTLVGVNHFEYLTHDRFLAALGELGVILLLFEIGLESSVAEMQKVGRSSFIVAVLGVIAPMALGWYVSHLFLPGSDWLVHLFVGATLCATSVGITARVLKDIGKLQTTESKIILGAAVIDDVLGLVVLAVLTGMVTAVNSGGGLEILGFAKIIGLSIGFFVVAIIAGPYLTSRYFRFFGYLKSRGLLLTAGLIICFGLAYIASLIGLAPIVGAFAAGLVLEDTHYEDLQSESDLHLHELLKPISTFIVPIFFVIMGAGVNLSVFGQSHILGFALLLTAAAIIGKQVCSLGVLDKKADRFAVGLGMIPRGEVGLIFASIGAGLTVHGQRLISSDTFSAIVIMVILTTMITPPILSWRFNNANRGKKRQ